MVRQHDIHGIEEAFAAGQRVCQGAKRGRPAATSCSCRRDYARQLVSSLLRRVDTDGHMDRVGSERIQAIQMRVAYRAAANKRQPQLLWHRRGGGSVGRRRALKNPLRGQLRTQRSQPPPAAG